MTTNTGARGVRRLAARALVVLAAFAVALAVWAATRTSEPGVGTAIDMPNSVGGLWDEAEVGERFTDVFVLVRTVDDRTITIESVEWLGDLEGIEILDVLISDDVLRADLLFGYPPDKRRYDVRKWGRAVNLRPAAGVTLEYRGKDAYNLAVGFEVTKPGYWYREAVRVHYVEDGRQFFQDLPMELIMCTEEGLQGSGKCPMPDLE